MSADPGFRVGLGYDSHRFDDQRPLLLGGVHFPDHAGLAGHSDADAVAHAITDAILGAAGAGNIGSHFPPSDPRWEGADSMDLLGRAARLVRDRGWAVANVDVTVVTESPKIGPRAREMSEVVSKVLGVRATLVSIKGKSNEAMGWIGRGEGLAVHAVALLGRWQPPS
ncbi:MAG: 2-C-methyl-D-erythritol 2,4-cyclodiphosphate synthase [Gemmatimonadota bacterium]